MTDAVVDKAEFEDSAASLNYQSWLPRSGQRDSSPLLGGKGRSSSSRNPNVRGGTQTSEAKSASSIYKELLESSSASQEPFVKKTLFGEVSVCISKDALIGLK